MKKLVIIWSNGDREELDITDEHAVEVLKKQFYKDLDSWTISTDTGALKLAHARSYWIE